MQNDTAAFYLRMAARIVRRCGEAVAIIIEQEAEDLHKYGWPDAGDVKREADARLYERDAAAKV